MSLIGPIYEETLHMREAFPVEPFNTISNLVFLYLVVHWARRVYKAPERHRLLAWGLPVLFIGFVGGTMFHGTRSLALWLLMDWLPIALLLLAVAVHFMRKVGLSWARAALVLLAPFGALALIRSFGVERSYGILLGYSLLTVPLLVPLSVYLRNTHWRHLSTVLGAVGLFAVAVSFRTIDRGLGAQLLPGIGTHFLWHLFGGVASFLIVRYVFLDGASQRPRPQVNDVASASP